MLSHINYELDLQLNEITCKHTHKNYNFQILLHDHLTYSHMLADDRHIAFTKQHRNNVGWHEHVNKEFFNMGVHILVLSLMCKHLFGMFITRKLNNSIQFRNK